jgi:chromosome segregation ATPase
MRYTLFFFLMLAIKTAPAADTDSLISEIRALRFDLQNTAATIQRVQIVMYRLQAQGASVERATGRLDMARGQCKQAQEQQKMVGAQIEQFKKQSPQSGVEQKNVEQVISQFQATMEVWVSQAQQCQGEQAEAEAQFRMEQAKMSELENQLEQLDQILAGRGRK